MRRVPTIAAVLAVGSVVVLGACSAEPVSPAPSPTVGAAELDRLRELTSEVADVQRDADQRLATALEAVREVDAIVSGLRDPERVDAAKGSWPAVDSAFTASQPEQLRDGMIELALTVDRARASLDRVRADVETRWEVRYLDAEDEVLVAVRDYARSADVLAQAVAGRWGTYAALHERTGRFVEQRWFYRTPQEAADAYELAVSPLLPDLAVAQEEIAAARRVRDAAARDVNEATDAADEVWDERPATPVPIAPSTSP